MHLRLDRGLGEPDFASREGPGTPAKLKQLLTALSKP